MHFFIWAVRIAIGSEPEEVTIQLKRQEYLRERVLTKYGKKSNEGPASEAGNVSRFVSRSASVV